MEQSPHRRTSRRKVAGLAIAAVGGMAVLGAFAAIVDRISTGPAGPELPARAAARLEPRPPQASQPTPRIPVAVGG